MASLHTRALAAVIALMGGSSTLLGCGYRPLWLSPDITRVSLEVTPRRIAGDGQDATRVSVHVTFANGAPVVPLRVRVLANGRADGVTQASETTDAQGELSAFITSLQPGTLTV